MSGSKLGSWLARLRPLSDSPLENVNGDLFELGAHVKLLAEAVLSSNGPLVVHVDGAWGRGKTSFCRFVEKELAVGRWCSASELADVEPGERISVRGRLYARKEFILEVDGVELQISTPTDQRSFVEGEEVVVTGTRSLRGADDPPSLSALRIARGYAYCSRYVASDDSGPASRSVLYAVAKAIAGPNDPEEAARIVRQWGADEELSAMRMDGFATWLAHELGRVGRPRRAAPVEIPLDIGGERVLRLELRANPRRSAVVFVDDLDRCHGDRVVEILEAIRSYVACPGLVFVIAADRRLIEQAFEQIVARDADRGRTSAAEAMEKYIHRRVELPSFAGFGGAELGRRLYALQQELVLGSDLFLLSIPTANFEQGVAVPLALVFGGSLTPRRLKRILNDFAIDMAEFVDRTHAHSALASRERWRELWVNDDPSAPLAFSTSEGATLPRYFAGRLLLRVAEHMWPSLFAQLDPRDDEFERRCERLAALASVRAQWSARAAERMRDEMLRELDPDGATPLRVRRQLCEFMAWVDEARRELVVDVSAMPDRGDKPAIVPQHAVLSDFGEEMLSADEMLREPVSSSPRAVDQKSLVATPTRSAPVRPKVRARPEPLSVEEYLAYAKEVEDELKRYVDFAGSLDEKGRDEALVEILAKLEILIDWPMPPDTVVDLVSRVLEQIREQVRERGVVSSEAFASLRACAAVAVDRVHWTWADDLHSVLVAAQNSPALTPAQLLAAQIDYARFLLDTAFHGDESMADVDIVITNWLTGDHPVPDEMFFDLLLIAAELMQRQPGHEFAWQSQVLEHRDRLRHRYKEGGREQTREYVKLLRAGGWDDPELDLLLGQRATLLDPQRGDPEITQAFADILVRRNTTDAYAKAKTLYLRLRGTPMWTPQVLHNLATAENALDPKDDTPGAHWLQAHRLAPHDPVIRRALSRFLRSRDYPKAAIMVSRGDPLPDDFDPFEERSEGEAQEAES